MKRSSKKSFRLVKKPVKDPVARVSSEILAAKEIRDREKRALLLNPILSARDRSKSGSRGDGNSNPNINTNNVQGVWEALTKDVKPGEV